MKGPLTVALPILLLTACATTPPMPNVAQPKTLEVDGQSVTLSGEYWVKKNQLILFANGDPLMRGNFPPYTPTLNLSSEYEGLPLTAYCYFGSVLQSEGGLVGAISGAIQGSKGKSGDKCEVKSGNSATQTLYF